MENQRQGDRIDKNMTASAAVLPSLKNKTQETGLPYTMQKKQSVKEKRSDDMKFGTEDKIMTVDKRPRVDTNVMDSESDAPDLVGKQLKDIEKKEMIAGDTSSSSSTVTGVFWEPKSGKMSKTPTNENDDLKENLLKNGDKQEENDYFDDDDDDGFGLNCWQSFRFFVK